MHDDELPFLRRLGLDDSADARAIRRAYARELKQIDQEQDGAAFQDLRVAYETALRWAAWRTGQTDIAPAAGPAPQSAPDAQPAPPAAPNYGVPRTPVALGQTEPSAEPEPPAFTPDDPQQAALAVLNDFRAAGAQLLARHHTPNLNLWQQALQHSLDDERLLNLTARVCFEAHIAHILASGWQPGHETLFVAASKLFHWSDDRRRLHQLGHAGVMIDKAIEERTMFDRLPEQELMIHRAAIALLRKDSQPTDYQLRNDMPYVERLMEFFPLWMSMMVDLHIVEQWRAQYRALPAPKKTWWPRLNLNISSRMGWVAFVVLLQIARMAFNHSDSSAEHHAPAGFAPPTPSLREPEFQRLPGNIQQEVAARIPMIPLQMGPGLHQAEFNIVLDQQGNIYQKMMYRTSDNRGYDEAASKALYASQPFPPETPRKFQVTFTIPTGSQP